MSTTLIVFLLYSFVCACFCGFVAEEKKRHPGSWVFLGLTCGIIALIALMALPFKQPTTLE